MDTKPDPSELERPMPCSMAKYEPYLDWVYQVVVTAVIGFIMVRILWRITGDPF